MGTITLDKWKQRLAEHKEAKATMTPQEYERYVEAQRTFREEQQTPVKKGPGPHREDYPHLSLVEFEALPERVAIKERAAEATRKAAEEYKAKVASGEIKPIPRAPSPKRPEPKQFYGRIGSMPWDEQIALMKKTAWSDLRGKALQRAIEKYTEKNKPKN